MGMLEIAKNTKYEINSVVIIAIKIHHTHIV